MCRGLGWKSTIECMDSCNHVCKVDRVCIKLKDINKEKYYAITMYLVSVNASDYITIWIYFTMLILCANLCDYIC